MCSQNHRKHTHTEITQNRPKNHNNSTFRRLLHPVQSKYTTTEQSTSAEMLLESENMRLKLNLCKVYKRRKQEIRFFKQALMNAFCMEVGFFVFLNIFCVHFVWVSDFLQYTTFSIFVSGNGLVLSCVQSVLARTAGKLRFGPMAIHIRAGHQRVGFL